MNVYTESAINNKDVSLIKPLRKDTHGNDREKALEEISANPTKESAKRYDPTEYDKVNISSTAKGEAVVNREDKLPSLDKQNKNHNYVRDIDISIFDDYYDVDNTTNVNAFA